jgi:hypothetical protein
VGPLDLIGVLFPASCIATRGDPPVEVISGFMRDECIAPYHS